MKLSRSELKILVYNKVKSGIPYEKAVEQVKNEIEHLKKLTKKVREKKKTPNFKEEFAKLQNGL